MATGIYVAAINPGSGKSLVSLGLGETLHSKADRIGYFRPITQGETLADDPMLKIMQDLFGLTGDQARGGLTQQEARAKIVDGNIDDISQHAVQVFSEMSEHCDVIIVEGTELDSNDSGVEFSLNITLANNLGILVLGVVNAKDLNTDEVVGTIDVARRELTESHASILGFIVNRAREADIKNIGEASHRGANNRPVYVLPELHDIAQPTVAEVAQSLNLRQITGDADHSDRDVQSIKVAAMTVANFMHELNDGALVIVPGDRSDAIVGAMASALIPEFPVPSGMILTGGLPIGENTQALLERAPFPVFEFAADTYTTANKVSRVRSELFTGHRRKISAAFGAWNTYISGEELVERLELPRPQKMTPLRFLHKLVIRARNDKKRIVLPEGTDERILRAAEILRRLNVCKIVILGNKSGILELAATVGADIEGIELIDPQTSALREEFAHEYAKLRAHKGMTVEKARDVMLSGNYFGAMMVRQNIADGMVSGAVSTTADTIRPALEFIKTAPGVSLVSSVFFMLMKDRVLVYGDCAINPTPTSEQLADIAIASAETSSQFDVVPKIAMLSYSTGTSGKGADVDKVRAATALIRERCPNLMVEGPIQYDAAVNASTAASKLPHSEVAGQATVFIFPDLNTGNNTYKAVQQSADAVAVGPVLQGLRKPVNDLSRGCTVDDIVNTVAITAIQAQGR